jgi:DNA-binding response OmpR family regulator
MKHILLVEDDVNLGFVIQDTLKQEGYKVTLRTDGKQGLTSFNKEYDLCLLDVMLPEMDGFELARAIRQVDADMPMIFLTAKSLIEDKITGFELGADDYITKPFSQQELLLRIKAILKRSQENKEQQTNNNILKFGSCSLEVNELALTIGDTSIKLTKKECKVLAILAQKKNEVIERELLLKLIWGNDSYFNGRSLDVFITKLRKHLKPDPNITIENIHGVGFKLVVS